MNRLYFILPVFTMFVAAVFILRTGVTEYSNEVDISGKSGVRNTRAPMRPLDPPHPLPEFRFKDDSGRLRSLEDYRGTIVLLNIWATWCPPCRMEMPSLDRLQAKLGAPRFKVLPVSTDSNGTVAVRTFYRRIGIRSLGIFTDHENETERKLKVPALPTTMLIDRSGQAVAVKVGPTEWDSEEMVAFLGPYLGYPVE